MSADVKTLLGITSNDDDGLIEFLINDAVNLVLTYCRISVLPYQLYGVIPQIAASMYRKRKNGGITSLAEGDRRIEYSGEDVLKDYYVRIMPFKAKLPSELDSNKLY